MHGSIFSDIFVKLGILILARHPAGHFEQVGEAPAWAKQRLACIRNRFPRILAADISSFLEDFMVEAQEIWDAARPEILRSGLWSEMAEDGSAPLHLEAWVCNVAEVPLLLILDAEVGYQEKADWLQTARQERLEQLDERKVVAERMTSASFYDGLTGLPNQALLMVKLSQWIENLHQHPTQTFLFLIVNLHRFQTINDRFGRDWGDQCLIQVGLRLKSVFRRLHVVARLGGDEFALLVQRPPPADIHLLLQSIQAVFQLPYQLGAESVRLSACIGVVVVDNPQGSPQVLLRNASIAMGQAKRLGAGEWVLFNEGMEQEVVSWLNWESRLQQAIVNQTLDLVFEPIVALATQKQAGLAVQLHRQSFPALSNPAFSNPAFSNTDVETLLRQANLIQALDRSILKQTEPLRDAAPAAMESHLILLPFHLASLTAASLRDQLTRWVAVAKGLSIQLVLIFDADPRAMPAMDLRPILEDLHRQGVGLALRDSGLSLATVTQVEGLPFEFLVVESSSLRLETEPALSLGQQFVQALHRQQVKLIVENVVAPTQVASLQALGVDYVKGPGVGQPLSLSQAQATRQQSGLLTQS
ncbi:GGDEF domain-containing protein [Lyngbya confervoides]|uniref:Diguanylate cyclase n=1 Tax=Lyngbya confervoides BDU141951 TaxID=1574623 RepID=A0ABD4T7I1_9CYAN|nr:diguanylate cyclase [Lyngbya confervoides]MCM1984571.1 diguanylate cyclase [Lyngbya confervoides BDU141951]